MQFVVVQHQELIEAEQCKICLDCQNKWTNERNCETGKGGFVHKAEQYK